MATAYTVDRAGGLVEEAVLDRVRHTDLEPAFLQPHVDAWFPLGVTAHGDSYILNGNQQATAINANTELIFEYVRRACFPTAPSRFESVFGCRSVEQAKAFRSSPTWGDPAAPIWEVETQHEPFHADMACLTLGGSILMTSYTAERYWAHQDNGCGRPPFWELLLKPPVTVVCRAA